MMNKVVYSAFILKQWWKPCFESSKDDYHMSHDSRIFNIFWLLYSNCIVYSFVFNSNVSFFENLASHLVPLNHYWLGSYTKESAN